jgi:hypothetical protein
VKVLNTAPTEQFAKMPRALLESDAWRSLGINELRLIHFLMLEHMRHGGKENGRLKATHRQLEQFGIGAQYVTGAILAVEERGLVACERGGMRVATTYALAWLPLHDGTMPAEQWRRFRDVTLAPLPVPRRKNLPAKGEAGLPYKGEADGRNLPAKGEAGGSKNLPYKGKALSRSSLPGRCSNSVLGGSAGALRVVHGGEP